MSIDDVDKFKQKEIKKIRPIKNTWYDWLINHIPEATRKSVGGFKDKIVILFKANIPKYFTKIFLLMKMSVKVRYTTYRRDRNITGGGIILYIRDDIPSTSLNTDASVEGLYVEINVRKKMAHTMFV